MGSYGKLILSFFILPLVGCRDTMTLHNRDQAPYLKGGQAAVEQVNEVTWKVGKKQNILLSQGISFSISTPQIKREDALELYRRFGIDSWLFKIERIGSQSGLIGHTQVRFTMDKGKPEFFKVSQAVVQILYAAAFVSERFRAFDCPAFNHRYRIDDLRLVNYSAEDLRLETISRKKLNHKLEQSYVSAAKFNGGSSLQGRYQISLALFNSRKKEYFGQFVPIEGAVVVGLEKKQEVAECLNARPEKQDPNSQKQKFRKFRWKN